MLVRPWYDDFPLDARDAFGLTLDRDDIAIAGGRRQARINRTNRIAAWVEVHQPLGPWELLELERKILEVCNVE